MRDPRAHVLGASPSVVFRDPDVRAAGHHAAPPYGAPSLALVHVTTKASLTPRPYEVDNRGPRLFDADGDGLRDQILPRTTYS